MMEENNQSVFRLLFCSTSSFFQTRVSVCVCVLLSGILLVNYRWGSEMTIKCGIKSRLKNECLMSLICTFIHVRFQWWAHKSLSAYILSMFLTAFCFPVYSVFSSLDMSRSVSVTAAGQCRLAPLIQVILDSSHLYDYTVKLLFKLHSCESHTSAGQTAQL